MNPRLIAALALAGLFTMTGLAHTQDEPVVPEFPEEVQDCIRQRADVVRLIMAVVDGWIFDESFVPGGRPGEGDILGEVVRKNLELKGGLENLAEGDDDALSEDVEIGELGGAIKAYCFCEFLTMRHVTEHATDEQEVENARAAFDLAWQQFRDRMTEELLRAVFDRDRAKKRIDRLIIIQQLLGFMQVYLEDFENDCQQLRFAFLHGQW